MEFINLSATASTLLITLYSRAAMSKNNMILNDKKADHQPAFIQVFNKN